MISHVLVGVRNPSMTRLAALVFSTLVLLSGCTGPTSSYSKASADVADFRRDSHACAQEPRMSWSASEHSMLVGARLDAKRQVGVYRMCMEAYGWTAN